jgi:uncharacterized Zn-binding protein involved in type VI secretion
MGFKTARVGDPISHGGTIQTGSTTRFIDGKGVARIGDTVMCDIHDETEITTGSSDVLVDGVGVAYVGSLTACGATIQDGDATVLTDPKQISYEFNGQTLVFDEYDMGAADDDGEIDDGLYVYPPVRGRSPTADELARSNAFRDSLPDDSENPEVNDSPPNSVKPLPTSCQGITDNSPSSLKLSPNFTLGNLTTGCVFSHPLVAQHGLSKAEIACNLRALSVNCLEKIAAQYGRSNVLITSGFRRGGGRSQHERGMAADIQFPGISNDEYWARAQWFKNNLPFDQLILEYHGRSPVLHVSFDQGKSAQRKQTLTWNKSQQTLSGLHKLR